MDRYEQDLDLTELNNDLSLDDILSEYQADAPFVPSPAPQAEPEDDPDDGFFRIAGEAVGRIRRTSSSLSPTLSTSGIPPLCRFRRSLPGTKGNSGICLT